ncbi:MAG: DUF1802 family protein [Akkermansiaceae bacterium]|nr:DUF1802 family protein [Akkermansiaceae bacterium]
MQVEEQFTTTDRDAFNRLDPLHVWTDEFLAQRLGKKEQPITALLLRVWQFAEPVNVPQCADYWGCFSWGVLQPMHVCNTRLCSEPAPLLCTAIISIHSLQGHVQLATATGYNTQLAGHMNGVVRTFPPVQSVVQCLCRETYFWRASRAPQKWFRGALG